MYLSSNTTSPIVDFHLIISPKEPVIDFRKVAKTGQKIVMFVLAGTGRYFLAVRLYR